MRRLGGDEFAVVLPRCSLEEAQDVAAEIATAVRERMRDETEMPPVTTSIGITPFGPGRQLSYESVLAKADAALYAAKGSGRDKVQTFDFDEPVASAAGSGHITTDAS